MGNEWEGRARFGNGNIPAIGQGARDLPRLNARGELVVVDFWTQLFLDGYVFHIQAGTEDAPATATGTIDDQLAMILADSTAGACIALFAQALIADWSTATDFNAMLEVDKEKNRYSAGGTAFVPEPLHGADAVAWQGVAYVAGASDITPAAKSAVPDSVELFRLFSIEDAQATPDHSVHRVDYNARIHPFCVALDAASIILHVGGGTADPSVYATLDVAQLPKSHVGA